MKSLRIILLSVVTNAEKHRRSSIALIVVSRLIETLNGARNIFLMNFNDHLILNPESP
jgi:hypothetical protein